MPYTEKQHKLFAAAAHNAKIAKKHGLTKSKATKMMKEGVKKPRGKATKTIMGKS